MVKLKLIVVKFKLGEKDWWQNSTASRFRIHTLVNKNLLKKKKRQVDYWESERTEKNIKEKLGRRFTTEKQETIWTLVLALRDLGEGNRSPCK